ncbi:hypothetical protein [Roseomonas fluvialis]|uniref:Uncharacterized protein n=1 Tax=Roseomonas fluvialis TaxID=1750527 RepID=A0ABM7YA77_9PROT|nr:hypothetical protein [Roseomonas fluvialis]BDG74988.1 hypothetical protein Rmf_49170 [Roseomonas fluvialis]
MLPHLSLRGDLDEVYAIHDVDEAFGVPAEKATIGTAGDLFDVLRSALPYAMAEDRDTWAQFRIALRHESGVNPDVVGRETLLIRPA